MNATADPPEGAGSRERGGSSPRWTFWVAVVAGAPLVAAGITMLALMSVPGLMPEDEGALVVLMALSAALGAVLPRALPHVRAVPLTVRRGWALAGALVAGVCVLPWVFALLFASLVLFCDGECVS